LKNVTTLLERFILLSIEC